MTIKKLSIATLSYIIITMMIAFPWHMIWFHDVYKTIGAITRPEPIILFGLIAVSIQGLAIAYLYPFYYRGGNPITQAIKFSLLFGAVIFSVMGFATAAKININPVSTFLIHSVIFQIIQFVLTGTALGLIYGRIEPNSPHLKTATP